MSSVLCAIICQTGASCKSKILACRGREKEAPAANGCTRMAHFALVAEAVLANQLQLLVEPLLLERPTRGDVGLAADLRNSSHDGVSLEPGKTIQR